MDFLTAPSDGDLILRLSRDSHSLPPTMKKVFDHTLEDSTSKSESPRASSRHSMPPGKYDTPYPTSPMVQADTNSHKYNVDTPGRAVVTSHDGTAERSHDDSLDLPGSVVDRSKHLFPVSMHPVFKITPKVKLKPTEDLEMVTKDSNEQVRITKLKDSLGTATARQRTLENGLSKKRHKIDRIERERRNLAHLMEANQYEISDHKSQEQTAHKEWKKAQTRHKKSKEKAQKMSNEDNKLSVTRSLILEETKATTVELDKTRKEVSKIELKLRRLKAEAEIKEEFKDEAVRELARKMRGVSTIRIKSETTKIKSENGKDTPPVQTDMYSTAVSSADDDSDNDDNILEKDNQWLEIDKDDISFGDIFSFHRQFGSAVGKQSVDNMQNESNDGDGAAQVYKDGTSTDGKVGSKFAPNANRISSTGAHDPVETPVENKCAAQITAAEIFEHLEQIELRKKKLNEIFSIVRGVKRKAEDPKREDIQSSENIGTIKQTQVHAPKRRHVRDDSLDQDAK